MGFVPLLLAGDWCFFLVYFSIDHSLALRDDTPFTFLKILSTPNLNLTMNLYYVVCWRSLYLYRNRYNRRRNYQDKGDRGLEGEGRMEARDEIGGIKISHLCFPCQIWWISLTRKQIWSFYLSNPTRVSPSLSQNCISSSIYQIWTFAHLPLASDLIWSSPSTDPSATTSDLEVLVHFSEISFTAVNPDLVFTAVISGLGFITVASDLVVCAHLLGFPSLDESNLNLLGIYSGSRNNQMGKETLEILEDDGDSESPPVDLKGKGKAKEGEEAGPKKKRKNKGGSLEISG